MGKWLATTWEGTVVKSVAGALLGALLSWLATAQVHPLIVGLGAAAGATLIDALNKVDSRYGIKEAAPVVESDQIASPVSAKAVAKKAPAKKAPVKKDSA